MSSTLTINNLHVTIESHGRPLRILRDISLDIAPGQTLALVGESGSGKSMTARSIMRLLPPGAQMDGAIEVSGVSVSDANERQMRALRGSKVAMIFQDPRSHINPLYTIGDFMSEQMVVNKVPRKVAWQRSRELLEEVQIDNPSRRMHQYPHELSGGMLQRVMIAAALASDPDLLIADESTTALDVVTQANVVRILAELCRARDLACLFISHDLDLALAVADRVAVMYAGQIIELRDSSDLRQSAKHPYTRGLLACRPDLRTRLDVLPDIPGQVISPSDVPQGCAFADRCAAVEEACTTSAIELVPVEESMVRCRRAGQLETVGAR